MRKSAYVYFLSNVNHNVLYVGVTNNLVRRVSEHKAKVNKGFTQTYNCDRLVYFEEFDKITDAIAREKQIKNWKRSWKDELVNKENTEWKDLSDSVGVTEEIIETIKAYYKGECVLNQVQKDSPH